jgi:dTDP-4-amino-4,6-dideoxygalactose transaminase
VTIPLNDLKRAYQEQAAELDEAALRVLRSGWYVHGPEHTAFEQEFAAYVGVAHCVGVGNGTDALELALRAVTAGRAGAVVTAANAGAYCTTAARRVGLGVRYADVDPATLCLTADTVRPLLAGGDVAAVVVTHLYGRLADVEALAALCADHGVPLVEDCAQAVGAQRGGRRAGSFGAVASFSFYPTKNLGALGDGGAVLTDDPELAATLARLRQYGWSGKYTVGQDGGRNSRLDELQAAVLRVRLPRVDGWSKRRRDIVRAYADAAAGTRFTVLPADGEDHVGHLAVGRTADRDGVRAALTAAGVATDVHYPIPDHRQPALAAEYASVVLPVTEAAAGEILSVPCFPQLTDAEVDGVCRALRAL